MLSGENKTQFVARPQKVAVENRHLVSVPTQPYITAYGPVVTGKQTDYHSGRISGDRQNDKVGCGEVGQTTQQLFVNPHHVGINRVSGSEEQVLGQLPFLSRNVQFVDKALQPPDFFRGVTRGKDIGPRDSDSLNASSGVSFKVLPVVLEIDSRRTFVAGVAAAYHRPHQKTGDGIFVLAVENGIVEGVGFFALLAVVNGLYERVAVYLVSVVVREGRASHGRSLPPGNRNKT